MRTFWCDEHVLDRDDRPARAPRSPRAARARSRRAAPPSRDPPARSARRTRRSASSPPTLVDHAVAADAAAGIEAEDAHARPYRGALTAANSCALLPSAVPALPSPSPHCLASDRRQDPRTPRQTPPELFWNAPQSLSRRLSWRARRLGGHPRRTPLQGTPHARRTDTPARERAPKIAVPMRTWVAPHAIATSKSPLMPIDSTGSGAPSASRSAIAQRAQRLEARGRGSSSGGGIVIRPSSADVRRSPAIARASSSAVVERDAALGRLAGDVDREQDRLQRRRALAELGRELDASRPRGRARPGRRPAWPCCAAAGR